MRLLLISSAVAALVLGLASQASGTFTSKLKRGKLSLTQTVDSGAATIDNNGAGGSFRVIEAGTTTFSTANSLVVKLLDGSSTNLSIDLDQPLQGQLVLDLGDGTRAVNFIGSSNTIHGKLEIQAGSGSQTIELSVNHDLLVERGATIDLGEGDDIVDNDLFDVTILGNLVMRGVNRWENNGYLLVDGDLSVHTDMESVFSDFDNDTTLIVLGDFTYVGGDAVDQVQLNATTFIAGNVTVDAGNGNLTMNFNSNTTFGGKLKVKSGSGNCSLNTAAQARFGGSISIKMGPGANNIGLLGTYLGKQITIRGGEDGDVVNWNARAGGTRLKCNLKGGADTFTLNAGADLKSLTVDFGSGVDSFNDGIGLPYPFKTTIKNLP